MANIQNPDSEFRVNEGDDYCAISVKFPKVRTGQKTPDDLTDDTPWKIVAEYYDADDDAFVEWPRIYDVLGADSSQDDFVDYKNGSASDASNLLTFNLKRIVEFDSSNVLKERSAMSTSSLAKLQIKWTAYDIDWKTYTGPGQPPDWTYSVFIQNLTNPADPWAPTLTLKTSRPSFLKIYPKKNREEYVRERGNNYVIPTEEIVWNANGDEYIYINDEWTTEHGGSHTYTQVSTLPIKDFIDDCSDNMAPSDWTKIKWKIYGKKDIDNANQYEMYGQGEAFFDDVDQDTSGNIRLELTKEYEDSAPYIDDGDNLSVDTDTNNKWYFERAPYYIYWVAVDSANNYSHTFPDEETINITYDEDGNIREGGFLISNISIQDKIPPHITSIRTNISPLTIDDNERRDDGDGSYMVKYFKILDFLTLECTDCSLDRTKIINDNVLNSTDSGWTELDSLYVMVKDANGTLVHGPISYSHTKYWSSLIASADNTNSPFPSSEVKWYHNKSPYSFHWYAKDSAGNWTNTREYITTLYVNDGVAPQITITSPILNVSMLGSDVNGVAECTINTPKIEFEEHEAKADLSLYYRINTTTKAGNSPASTIITVGSADEINVWKLIANSDWDKNGQSETLFFNIEDSMPSPIEIHWKVEDDASGGLAPNVRGGSMHGDDEYLHIITISDFIGPEFRSLDSVDGVIEFSDASSDFVNWPATSSPPPYNYELNDFKITPNEDGYFSLIVSKPIVVDNYKVDDGSWEFKWFEESSNWQVITESDWGSIMSGMVDRSYDHNKRDDYSFYLKVSDDLPPNSPGDAVPNTSIAKINIEMVDGWAPTWDISPPTEVKVDLVLGATTIQVSEGSLRDDVDPNDAASISTIIAVWPNPIDPFSKGAGGVNDLSKIDFYYRIKRNAAYTSAWTKVTDLTNIFSGIGVNDDLEIIDNTTSPTDSTNITIEWAVRDWAGNILDEGPLNNASTAWPAAFGSAPPNDSTENWKTTVISVTSDIAPVFKVSNSDQFNSNDNIHIADGSYADSIFARLPGKTEQDYTIHVPKVTLTVDSELKTDHISGININDIYLEYKIIHEVAPVNIETDFWDTPMHLDPFNVSESENVFYNGGPAAVGEIKVSNIGSPWNYPTNGEQLTFQYGNINYDSEQGVIFNVYWRAKYGDSGAWSNNFAFYKIQFQDQTSIRFSAAVETFTTDTVEDGLTVVGGAELDTSMAINYQSQSAAFDTPRIDAITVIRPSLVDADLDEHTYTEISFRYKADWADESDNNWVNKSPQDYVGGITSPASLSSFETTALHYGKTEINWTVENKNGTQSIYTKTIKIYNVLDRKPIFSNNQENWWNNGNDYDTNFQVRNVTVELSSTDTTSNNINKKTFENTGFEDYYYQSGKDIATIPYGKIDVDTWEYEITDESGGNDISVLLGGDVSGIGTNTVTFYFQPKTQSSSHKIRIRWRVFDTEELRTSNYIYESYTLEWNSWLGSTNANDLFNSWKILDPEDGQEENEFVVEWKKSNITSPNAILGQIVKLNEFMDYNKSEFFGRGANDGELSLRDAISFWEKVVDQISMPESPYFILMGKKDKKSYLRSIDEISLPSMRVSGPVGYTVNLKIYKNNHSGWATPFGICYFGNNKDDNTHYSGLKDGWILKFVPFDPSPSASTNNLQGTLEIIKLTNGSTTVLAESDGVNISNIDNIDLELKIVKSQELNQQGNSSGWIHIGAIYCYDNNDDRYLLNSISLVHANDNTDNLGFQDWDVSKRDENLLGSSSSKSAGSSYANVDPNDNLTNGGFVSVFVEPQYKDNGTTESWGTTELWIESIKISGATYCIAKYNTNSSINDYQNVDLKDVYTLYSWVDPGAAETKQELYPAGELHGEMQYYFKWVVVDLLGESKEKEKLVTVKATGPDTHAPTTVLNQEAWMSFNWGKFDPPDNGNASSTNLYYLRQEDGLLPARGDITATDDYVPDPDDIVIEWRVWFSDGESYNSGNDASFPDEEGWTTENSNYPNFPSELGTYRIEYRVSDNASPPNRSSVFREIYIKDNALPTIIGDTFTNDATEKYDKNSSKITIGTSDVICNDNRLSRDDARLEVYFKVDGLLDWRDIDYDISTDTVKTFTIRYKVQKFDRNDGDYVVSGEVLRYIQIEEVDVDNWWPSAANTIVEGETLKNKFGASRYQETPTALLPVTRLSGWQSKLLYAANGEQQEYFGGTINVILYNFSRDCLNFHVGDISNATGLWVWYMGHEDGEGYADETSDSSYGGGSSSPGQKGNDQRSIGLTITKDASVRFMTGGKMRDSMFRHDNLVSGSTRYDILFSMSMSRSWNTDSKAAYDLKISTRLHSSGVGGKFSQVYSKSNVLSGRVQSGSDSSKSTSTFPTTADNGHSTDYEDAPFYGWGDHSTGRRYTSNWADGIWIGGTAGGRTDRAFDSNMGVSFRASVLSNSSKSFGTGGDWY